MISTKIFALVTLSIALMACGGGSNGNSENNSSDTNSNSSLTSTSSSSTASETSSNASESSSSASSDASLVCEIANNVQGFATLGAGTSGGTGGTKVIVNNGVELVAALASKKNNLAPLVIYINGTITPANSGGAQQFDVKDMDNLSIIGVNNNALFDGIGINIVRANNIIVRNLTMRYVRIGQKDAISIDGDEANPSTNIWIDHNELYNDLNTDKDYYDELVSGKRHVDNVTISYNYLHDSWKTSLWGFSESDSINRRITFHHNRWENVNSRLPLFRAGEGHLYNNYYKNVLGSAINSRMGATIRIDGNHFEDAKNPIISMDSDTLGYWDVASNLYEDVEWGVPPAGNCNGTTNDASDPCVYGAAPGIQNGGETTSTVSYVPPYVYTLMPAEQVRDHVIAYAGANKINACLDLPTDIGSSSSSNVSADSSSSDSSSSSSASSNGGVGIALPYAEDFNVDKTVFFSADYKAISIDETAAMNFITGGNSGITLTDGAITLSGTRFTIGNRPPRAPTLAGDSDANGDLDLSNSYKISLRILTASGPGKFQITVDNNTTSGAASIHGGASRVYDMAASALTAGQIIEITPTLGTSSSFISIRTESNTSVTFDDFLIDYVE